MTHQAHLPKALEPLLSAETYDHPVASISIIETHISWVILTGSRAYKVKKPVNFGFIDTEDLDDRRRFCELELRLNRRLAPELYIGVAALIPTAEGVRLRMLPCHDEEDASEFAVVMNQFSQDHLLHEALERRDLQASHFEQFAEDLARIHEGSDLAPADPPYGCPDELHGEIAETCRDIEKLGHQLDDVEAGIRAVNESLLRRLESQRSYILRRQSHGAIRECHGDLHCGNLLLQDDRLIAFDGIEFNESFRFIDRLNDVAFLVMDLEKHGCVEFAQRFLNRYLECSGDYEGLRVLSIYVIYRALIRVKVALIRASQIVEGDDNSSDLAEAREYWQVVKRWQQPNSNWVIAMRGLSGSGKSIVARTIADHSRAIRIRSDVERKRLGRISSFLDAERMGRRLDQEYYSEKFTEHVYDRINDLAGEVLNAGFPVVVDATCLQHRQLQSIHRVAKANEVPFAVVALEVDKETLVERILQRRAFGVDPSDADVKVLENQIKNAEPLEDDSLSGAIVVHLEPTSDIVEVAQSIVKRVTR